MDRNGSYHAVLAALGLGSLWLARLLFVIPADVVTGRLDEGGLADAVSPRASIAILMIVGLVCLNAVRPYSLGNAPGIGLAALLLCYGAGWYALCHEHSLVSTRPVVRIERGDAAGECALLLDGSRGHLRVWFAEQGVGHVVLLSGAALTVGREDLLTDAIAAAKDPGLRFPACPDPQRMAT